MWGRTRYAMASPLCRVCSWFLERPGRFSRRCSWRQPRDPLTSLEPRVPEQLVDLPLERHFTAIVEQTTLSDIGPQVVREIAVPTNLLERHCKHSVGVPFLLMEEVVVPLCDSHGCRARLGTVSYPARSSFGDMASCCVVPSARLCGRPSLLLAVLTESAFFLSDGIRSRVQFFSRLCGKSQVCGLQFEHLGQKQ